MKYFDKIVLSSDEGGMYLPFLPYVSMAWKKLYGVEVVLSLVSDKSENDPFVEDLRKYAKVILIKPVKGIPTIVNAKLARYYVAQSYLNDRIMISDLDLIPLSTEFNKHLSCRKVGEILLFGYNLYTEQQSGKSIAHGTTTEGLVWKEIINPNNFSSFEEFLYFYNTLDNYELDKINKVENEKFSDETAMRSLIKNWGKEELVIKIPWFNYNTSDKIIDRADWKLDLEKLRNGYYVYSHMLRPLSQYKNELMPIFSYIEGL